MIPNATKHKLLNGSIDLSADTIRVALMKDTTDYVADPDNHEFVSNVLDGGTTAAEFDDTNYSRQTLSNQATSQDNTDDEGVFDADNMTWTNLGGSQSVHGVLIYKQVGGDDTTPGDDPIIRVIDDSDTSELPKATNGDDFTVEWDAEGIVNLS